jgi:hypothetical protein
VIHSAGGVKHYEKVYQSITKRINEHMVTMPIILDVEEHHTADQSPLEEGEQPQVSDDEEELEQPTQKESQSTDVQLIEFSSCRECMDLDGAPKQEFTSKEHEYMYWRNRLGHLSKTRIRQLAKGGGIPKHLSTIDPPLCISYIHGKATKKPWRTKSEPSKTPEEAACPGQCVSVDQIESSTAGFIGQLKGAIITTKRYRYATIFMDIVQQLYICVSAPIFDIRGDTEG